MLDSPCMVFQRMCVVRLDSRCSFHMFCLCFCMLEVILSFRNLRAGSQNDVCENSIGSVYVSGYCGLSESKLCLR